MKDLNNVSFDYDGEKLYFRTSRYSQGNGLAIQIESDYEPYTMLSVNIPGVPLEDGEVIIKTWSENELIAEFLRGSEWFEDTGKRVQTGFVHAEIWKIREKGEPMAHLNNGKGMRQTSICRINTVGELRRFLNPFDDECEITGLFINYYVQMNGNGALKLRIAADIKKQDESLLGDAIAIECEYPSINQGETGKRWFRIKTALSE